MFANNIHEYILGINYRKKEIIFSQILGLELESWSNYEIASEIEQLFKIHKSNCLILTFCY